MDKEPPLVSNVTVTPSLTNGTIAVYATARVDDATKAIPALSRPGKYRRWERGSDAASDGSFSEAAEDVKATIPASVVNALDEGSHTVCVQGKDLAGDLRSFSASGACATLEIDKPPPEVTIDQKPGQADPADTSPVDFKVSFTENVSDFANGDVTLAARRADDRDGNRQRDDLLCRGQRHDRRRNRDRFHREQRRPRRGGQREQRVHQHGQLDGV